MNLGDILTIGCAICFTFHVIFVGRASQRFPFEQVAFLQVGTAAILMTVSTPLLEHPYFRADANGDRRNFDYRNSVYGSGFQRPILGAAIYPRHPYRADFHHGTGLCLAHVFYLSA